MTPDEVVSVQSDELVLEAFKKMKDNKIGGLPVVEGSNKKIVGNVSIRDIRFLLLTPFSNFRQLIVKDFISTVANAAPDTRKVINPITCKLDTTLQNIHTIASNSVHRIYVVDDDVEGVIGVITLRDVISCFIYEPPNSFDKYFGFAAQEMLGI